MKRSKIEMQLREEAQKHTPDPYNKIVLSAQAEGLLRDEPKNVEVYHQGNTAVLSTNKKRIAGIAALFAVVVVCLAIVLPIVLKGIVSPILPQYTDLSANDVYGMGAVSTVKLLGGDMSVKAIGKLSAVRSVAANAEDETDAENAVKEQVRKFNEYFTALDNFMGEEIVTTVSEKNTNGQYPYETKLTINSKNFNGEAVQNIMYFTETLKTADDDETEYTLEGVLVVDGIDYHLEGERSVEQEKDETENELKIRAYADLSDKSSYVEMEQEHSVENDETEIEYVYSIYSNGVLIEQTAVEFETEKDGDQEEVEYELEFLKGDAKGKYVVERVTENGHVQMKVKYNIDGQQGDFCIKKSQDNKYSYFFVDGTVLSF